ncbi:MAG: hypothetical protein RIT81_20565 [Deltaproteobacteria bacterium]
MSVVAIACALIAFSGFGFASRRFVRSRITAWSLRAFGPGALTVAFTLGLFLSTVAPAARLLGGFDLGLVVSAVLAIVLAFATRRLPVEALPRASRRTEWWFAVVLVGMGALYTNLSLRYQMHDEHAVYGHKSMVEQLRRGVYPMYYPSSPSEEARYHYGFDVLAGVFTRGLDLSSDLAIDLVCILLALFMCWAAAAVAADADAERSAPFAAAAIHLGAGLAFFLLAGVDGRHPRCLTQYHHPTCEVELFPTQLLNVFQHPVSLGVPLFLTAVLMFPRLAGRSNDEPVFGARWWSTAAMSIAMLGGLSVGQFVYYALGVLAALASLPVWGWRAGRGLRPYFGLAIVVGLSFVLAYAIGGMLAPNESIDPNLVRVLSTPGFPAKEPVSGILWHHAVNLGIGFLLLPLFIWVSMRERRSGVVMLTAFAIGGIAVAHLFTYTRSWDIVKFPSAASFALSMLFVVVVDRWLAARTGWLERWARRFGVAAVCGTGVVAATFVLFPLDGANRLYGLGTWQGNGLVRQCIDWLRSHDYASEDVVYAQSNVAMELSVWGGLSVVAEDTDLFYMGVKNSVLQKNRRLSSRLRASLDDAAIAELGVKYLVFSDEELGNLGRRAQDRLRQEEGFEKLVSFPSERPGGTRSIWRVR